MKEPRSDLPPVALTIAGLDPSGGAGVIADIRAFVAFGCFPTAAISSITFQNTAGVFGFSHQSAETVRAQVLPILEDLKVASVKTGMLPTREVIAEVARLFRETNLPSPVVDPVLRSTSGATLIDDDARETLVRELIPLARVVTPNVYEAEHLTGLKILDEGTMRQAAEKIRDSGARAVLIKGGHLNSQEAIDMLDEGGRVTTFRGKRVAGAQIHGAGCTLSAAIVACLAKGMELDESIRQSKEFVYELISRAQFTENGVRVLI